MILVTKTSDQTRQRDTLSLLVCVCVFIKLHITAQSGLVILVILCHLRLSSQGGINDTCYDVCVCVCVCVCVYVFFKLHTTTQSGPVILVILCHYN